MRFKARRAVFARGAALGAAIVASMASAGARADEAVEPSYGRIDGDVTLVLGAGGSVASNGVRAVGDLRARYLETAGIFATYEDGALVGTSADPARLLVVGLELRPLFLYRWLRGQETRRARWDLAIDSFGLDLGVTWQGDAEGGGLAAPPGVEAGLGVELPLMAEATGLWLSFHGGARWSDDAQASGTVQPRDRQAYLAVTLAWHQVASMHIVDIGDRPPR